jgi:hypothetical protein
MNFQHDRFLRCESKLNEDMFNANASISFNLVEERVSISESSFMNDFRFEEIIFKKLRINAEYAQVENKYENELSYKEDNQDLLFNDTTQAIPIFDMPDLSLFEDDKNIVDDELNFKDENIYVEDTPIEEESAPIELKAEKVQKKSTNVSKEASSIKDTKNTRFGKKDD